MAGLEFPEHNFVFTEQFTELLKTYRTDRKNQRFWLSIIRLVSPQFLLPKLIACLTDHPELQPN